jgi:hypothetical protein
LVTLWFHSQKYQIGIQQKNQHDGKSNVFLKMMAKMFVQMRYNWQEGHDLKDVRFTFVIPTFLDQVIISPYGMPCYELLLDKQPEFAICNYDNECYSPFLGSDSTGTRVATYINHVYLAEELKGQQCFLSCPQKEVKFVNTWTLAALQARGSFLALAHMPLPRASAILEGITT